MSKKEEKQFFDRLYKGKYSRRGLWSSLHAVVFGGKEYYYEKYLKEVFKDMEGKLILECGCGKGSYAFQLAGEQATVVGIDISGAALKETSITAKGSRINSLFLLACDAEKMSFKDNSFDGVVGHQVLHHLSLGEFLPELKRILIPQGRAIFIEPMGYNPVINAVRRLTPHLRTRGEHPFVNRDLRLISRYFKNSEFKFFHLFSYLAVPFENTPIFPRLIRKLLAFDAWLFDFLPFLKPLAWQVVIMLYCPDK